MSVNAKVFITWIGVLIFRLLPWRAPNVEPLLATILPISARTQTHTSIIFVVMSIVVYDALTSGIGLWTYVTVAGMLLVSVGGQMYFSTLPATRSHMLGFGIVATVVYDILTGIIAGPLLWHQSFATALSGQIPFTLLHVSGTILFTLVLSPMLLKWYNQAPQQILLSVSRHSI